ncbi:conjugal transfer protein TraC [Streptomyces sp. NPDC003077]|uniref:VirB4 family type IV secretion system protein n=1 Tax=Streptomyces sp. NPDC003077 TaxID=3154443 RepID=UPI0033B1473F
MTVTVRALLQWPRRSRQPSLISGREVFTGLGPEAVEVRARYLQVGGHLAATLIITGYPAEVHPGWLQPLLTYPGHLDVALHIDPVPTPVAADSLRKQRARLESSRRTGFDRGRLEDPGTEAAAADAAELAHRIARGEGKLFRVGLYVTVHAPDEGSLAEEVASVRAVAESLLLTAVPATYRALPGWLATLPLGIDTLAVRRTFDTTALATCFPFASPDLPAPAPGPAGSAVLYGVNAASSSLLLWDRFAQDNYNSITLARSGAGKSYLTKLELLRQLCTGTEAFVVDPEDEYLRVAEQVGGTVLRLGASGVRLNPFDLPTGIEHTADALTRRALFLHTFLAVLLGTEPTATEKAVLDTAILTTYERAGITSDPHTWHRPAPLLGDLAHVLRERADTESAGLAERLAPYTTGSHAGLFNGPTTTSPSGHLVVLSLRQLPEELLPAGMLLALDVTWRQVAQPTTRRKRLVVVDEAWRLMSHGAGAQFLFRMAKAARKHWAGLAVVTQDADDVLASDLGRAIVSNAATQILLRQAPQAIDQITAAFQLSRGERDFLLTAERGCALLLAGRHKAAFYALASPAEHTVVTTDPAELATALATDSTDPDDDALDPYGDSPTGEAAC